MRIFARNRGRRRLAIAGKRTVDEHAPWLAIILEWLRPLVTRRTSPRLQWRAPRHKLVRPTSKGANINARSSR
jgi:hypothetical protein